MKREPAWVEKRFVLPIHDELLVRFGGVSGLRDEGLLDSALDSPKNRFHYGETDVFMLATAYAQAISRNHPFVDGNKRVALTCAGLFLMLNGFTVKLPEADAVVMVIKLATNKVTEREFADWLKTFSRRGRRS